MEQGKPFFNVEPVENGCVGHSTNSLRVIFNTLLLVKGVKQQKLADFLGFDKGYISRICNGLENPPLRVKLKIAEFFDCDTALIWREND